jgi:methylmalonyl-CoA mutase C-terminal domain/subunit
MRVSGSTEERIIRVVVAKVGLDGHDRGAKVIARAYRDAGMEVIYTGLRRSPIELVSIVLQEDADVLGLSILSGAVVPWCRQVVEAFDDVGLDDVTIIVGGIVGAPAIRGRLSELGISGAFGPGSSLAEIIAFTRDQVRINRGLER